MSKEHLLAIVKELEDGLLAVQAGMPIFGLVTYEAVRLEAEKLQLALEAIDISKLKDLITNLYP